MGIRIKKLIGYGLSDVKTEKMKCIDDRINPKNMFFEWDFGEGEVATNQEYIKHVKKLNHERSEAKDYLSQNLDIAWGASENEKFNIWDAYDWNPEFGLPNILLLRPITNYSWYRYDDDIDYVEETYLTNEGQVCRYEILQHGIYPYLGYMDKDSGERLEDYRVRWVIWNETKSSPPHDENLLKIKTAASIALGYESYKEALEQVVPIVPQEIKDLAEFTNLFTNDEVWKQLRPMLYIYWS